MSRLKFVVWGLILGLGLLAACNAATLAPAGVPPTVPPIVAPPTTTPVPPTNAAIPPTITPVPLTETATANTAPVTPTEAEAQVDYSNVKLAAADLPSNYTVLTADELKQIGIDQTSFAAAFKSVGKDAALQSFSGFLDRENFKLLMGFVYAPFNVPEQAALKQELGDPDTMLKFFGQSVRGTTQPKTEPIAGVDNLGEKSLGFTTVLDSAPPLRIDSVLVQRGPALEMVLVMYQDGKTSNLDMGDVTYALDTRVAKSLGQTAAPRPTKPAATNAPVVATATATALSTQPAVPTQQPAPTQTPPPTQTPVVPTATATAVPSQSPTPTKAPKPTKTPAPTQTPTPANQCKLGPGEAGLFSINNFDGEMTLTIDDHEYHLPPHSSLPVKVEVGKKFTINAFIPGVGRATEGPFTLHAGDCMRYEPHF